MSALQWRSAGQSQHVMSLYGSAGGDTDEGERLRDELLDSWRWVCEEKSLALHPRAPKRAGEWLPGLSAQQLQLTRQANAPPIDLLDCPETRPSSEH